MIKFEKMKFQYRIDWYQKKGENRKEEETKLNKRNKGGKKREGKAR